MTRIPIDIVGGARDGLSSEISSDLVHDGRVRFPTFSPPEFIPEGIALEPHGIDEISAEYRVDGWIEPADAAPRRVRLVPTEPAIRGDQAGFAWED